jgi:hypothetical protein
MATDLQDLARRLFKAAETMWTNTVCGPTSTPSRFWR